MNINKPRLPSSYSDSVKDASYLIAFNPEKVIHYGSSAKKAMYLSSSDVDLIEPVHPTRASNLAAKFKTIVKNIDKAPLCYLGDFKSGMDAHYVCDIGRIKGCKVIGFDAEKVKAFVQSRDFEAREEIIGLLKDPMTIDSYLKLEELMRKNQVLRWDRKELLQGYKTVRGRKVPLSDTIKDESSMTKIDTIQWIPTESRLVEVTNYFKVSKSKDSFNAKDYGASLQKDIVKTYYNGNLFKMCKRLLSFSLLLKDEKTANKLYEIVHSGLGIMYQVVADIKAILYLKEHYSNLPIAHINTMIDGFKDRLGNIYEFDFKEEATDKLIDSCKADYDKLYTLLETLYTVLIKQTQSRLVAMKLYPLPKGFYPA